MKTKDLLPSIAYENALNVSDTNAVFFRQPLWGAFIRPIAFLLPAFPSLAARNECSTNLRHQFGSKFRHAIVFARQSFAVRNAISVVIGMGSQMKVSRIYAAWIIAMMKHVQSSWNLAFIELPRDSMRSQFSWRFAVGIGKNPIAQEIGITSPFPAFIKHLRVETYSILANFLARDVNFIPESFMQWLFDELPFFIDLHDSLYHRNQAGGAW